MTNTDTGAQSTAPLLEIIQKLQFTDRPQAEKLLQEFIAATFPTLEIVALELRPLATSLNSFNGFLTLADQSRLFFKTHVEQDNQIGEYYNARLLADAGYPVIQPLYSSTHSGQQLLIYPVITDPPVFDVARTLETQPALDEALFAALTEAQNKSDDELYNLYLASLAPQNAINAAEAPVHQLFYHRLTGGRLDRFYGAETSVNLPHGEYSFEAIRQQKWAINGAVFAETLDDLIQQAITLLQPEQAGISIVGHGDAHNGNVFFNAEARQMTYFDPAFAGRHHPLLDLTKPLFHNVFAMWMYFPESEREKLKITIQVDGDRWIVEHNYRLNPARQMFLQSKVQRVLIPILQQMKNAGTLIENWRPYLKAALFCCPFLTLDLKRFPPEIALLGLTMAVQMGAESQQQRSVIDTVLDEMERQL